MPHENEGKIEKTNLTTLTGWAQKFNVEMDDGLENDAANPASYNLAAFTYATA